MLWIWAWGKEQRLWRGFVSPCSLCKDGQCSTSCVSCGEAAALLCRVLAVLSVVQSWDQWRKSTNAVLLKQTADFALHPTELKFFMGRMLSRFLEVPTICLVSCDVTFVTLGPSNSPPAPQCCQVWTAKLPKFTFLSSFALWDVLMSIFWKAAALSLCCRQPLCLWYVNLLSPELFLHEVVAQAYYHYLMLLLQQHNSKAFYKIYYHSELCC